MEVPIENADASEGPAENTDEVIMTSHVTTLLHARKRSNKLSSKLSKKFNKGPLTVKVASPSPPSNSTNTLGAFSHRNLFTEDSNCEGSDFDEDAGECHSELISLMKRAKTTDVDSGSLYVKELK